MKTINFKEINFSERLKNRVTSNGKLKMIPLEVVIEMNDLVDLAKDKIKSLNDSLKESKSYLKDHVEAAGTIYQFNLPMSKDFYEQKIKNLEETIYYLRHLSSFKNIGYQTEPEFLILPAENEKERKSLKNYLDNQGSYFVSYLLRSLDIQGFILGTDSLKIINIKTSKR